MRRAVLMGDPAHFSVQGGANPHTRNWLGQRRRVNVRRAIDQWHGLRHVLRDAGVRVIVVPPHPAQPGLVYPANAGFLTDVDGEKSLSQKTFYLSNLLPTRAGEKSHYRQALRYSGFRVRTIDERYRFEGEADFFPVAEYYVLTHGGIERQRFVPTLGLPPWRRVYGFRTDARVEPILAGLVKPRPVLRIELALEAHYHGDTALCAFGPERQHLLVYRRALTEEAWDVLERELRHALVELSEEDARRYAANSFTLTQGSDSLLIMPGGVSQRLQDQVRERGVTPVTVDVSEFLKKGGGSVKCMIGDLGPVSDTELLGSSGESRGSRSS
jgi:N-dimethylarginine dimethylaminohydrolase